MVLLKQIQAGSLSNGKKKILILSDNFTFFDNHINKLSKTFKFSAIICWQNLDTT
ncbi:hypothetical protein Aazo_4579 ['Nostoc azollae' 0708]|uniref:Uncharacterized protein n=1 Tax=Nostoc azollae (strain 0708) TaxID=551115 RepID=D7DXB4_NOSA0|nr:hypothetical protein Aazo_4579 ['Nostoc azollae' 0708]